MERTPLRLGTSTSGLFSCLPEDIRKLIWQSETFSQEEDQRLRSIARECAELIAASEIRALEFFTTLPVLVLGENHPMAEMVNKLGTSCEAWSVHAPFGGVDLASPDEDTRLRSTQDAIRAAKLASAIGAQVLTVHPALEIPDAAPRSVRMQASGRSLADIADVCAPLGIRVAVEILPRKCIGNSLAELFAIVEAADRPNIGICLDTNHLFPASALVDVAREIGPRLATLHVSDNDDIDERHWLPMRGVIDWPAFVRSLPEINYTGPFMYEVGLARPTFAEGISALETNYRELMSTAGL